MQLNNQLQVLRIMSNRWDVEDLILFLLRRIYHTQQVLLEESPLLKVDLELVKEKQVSHDHSESWHENSNIGDHSNVVLPDRLASEVLPEIDGA